MGNGATSIVGMLGAGSGVDMIKLAGDLSAARFAAQAKQLQTRSERLETRISAAATLKGQLSQLVSALGQRLRSGDLAPSAIVSNPAVARAETSPGSRGEGSYSLEVTALAARQVLASKTYPTPEAKVGAGELTIQFGTVLGDRFDPDASALPLRLTLTADDTLATLAGKITRQGTGLAAYTVQTQAGAQLVIKGPEGAARGFTISTGGGAPDAQPGELAYLNWLPQQDTGELKAAAADAAFMLDGVAMTSAGNDVTGLPNGLVLALTGTNSGAPAQISFAGKADEIRTVMTDMTAALNEIAVQLQDNARPVGGELGNDSGARALKRSLAALPGAVVMPNAAPGAPHTLGELGLVHNRDGSFHLDLERLNRTLAADPRGAAAMFTPGLFGVYATMEKLARNIATTADPGSLGGSIARYQQQKARLGDRLDRLQQQQDVLRAQLAGRFTQADRRVSASQNTWSFLQNQIAVWTRSDR